MSTALTLFNIIGLAEQLIKYYEGSGHNGLFTDPSRFDDTVERVSIFLRKKLKK